MMKKCGKQAVYHIPDCGVDAAKKSALKDPGSLGKLKKSAYLTGFSSITGCAGSAYKEEEFLKEMPEVDAIVGTTGISGITDAPSMGPKVKDCSELRMPAKTESRNRKEWFLPTENAHLP